MNNSKTLKKNIVLTIGTLFFIIFIISGVLILVSMGKATFESIKSYTFAKTTGEIVYSNAKLIKTITAKRVDSKVMVPDIKYNYFVDGVNYQNNKIVFDKNIVFSGPYWLGQTYNYPSSTKELLKKYPKNKLVEVYYNKSNPGESVLERKFPFKVFIFLPAGLLFLWVGYAGIKSLMTTFSK